MDQPFFLKHPCHVRAAVMCRYLFDMCRIPISTLLVCPQMVSALQNGTASYAGLRAPQEGSYPLPVRSISTTSTIKVSLCVDTVTMPEARFQGKVSIPLGCDSTMHATVIV